MSDAMIDEGLAQAVVEPIARGRTTPESAARKLRNLFRGSLPLRVTERLTSEVVDGRGEEPWTDATHVEPMDVENELRDEGSRPPLATLLDVLDVADRLYERVAAVLEPVGLSYPAYELLEYLYQARMPVATSRLAGAHGCDLSTLQQLADRLERDGLIVLTQKTSGSAGQVALAPAGRVRTLVARSRVGGVSAEFASAFAGSDRAALGRLLARICR